MKDLNIIKAIAALDSGDSTYVNGDLNEIRALCDEIGSFYVIPVTGNQCKITKAKSSTGSFYGNLASLMNAYNGTPITLKEDVQKVRMSVSRFNTLNGRTFSVRSVDAVTAEVFSTNLSDHASITIEMFQEEVERYAEKLRKLRALVADADENALNYAEMAMTQTITSEHEEDDDDDEAEQHDPSIFVTRANLVPEQPVEEWKPWRLDDCDTCGEEFSTQDKQQTTCDDCRVRPVDDDDDIV